MLSGPSVLRLYLSTGPGFPTDRLDLELVTARLFLRYNICAITNADGVCTKSGEAKLLKAR
jgi:hypothetical protein